MIIYIKEDNVNKLLNIFSRPNLPLLHQFFHAIKNASENGILNQNDLNIAIFIHVMQVHGIEYSSLTRNGLIAFDCTELEKRVAQIAAPLYQGLINRGLLREDTSQSYELNQANQAVNNNNAQPENYHVVIPKTLRPNPGQANEVYQSTHPDNGNLVVPQPIRTNPLRLTEAPQQTPLQFWPFYVETKEAMATLIKHLTEFYKSARLADLLYEYQGNIFTLADLNDRAARKIAAELNIPFSQEKCARFPHSLSKNFCNLKVLLSQTIFKNRMSHLVEKTSKGKYRIKEGVSKAQLIEALSSFDSINTRVNNPVNDQDDSGIEKRSKKISIRDRVARGMGPKFYHRYAPSVDMPLLDRIMNGETLEAIKHQMRIQMNQLTGMITPHILILRFISHYLHNTSPLFNNRVIDVVGKFKPRYESIHNHLEILHDAMLDILEEAHENNQVVRFGNEEAFYSNANKKRAQNLLEAYESSSADTNQAEYNSPTTATSSTTSTTTTTTATTNTITTPITSSRHQEDDCLTEEFDVHQEHDFEISTSDGREIQMPQWNTVTNLSQPSQIEAFGLFNRFDSDRNPAFADTSENARDNDASAKRENSAETHSSSKKQKKS